MKHNFKSIFYLKKGNIKQQLAFIELNELSLFEKLAKYQPTLCGTIPIEIDTDESDLDVVCYCKDVDQFYQEIKDNFFSQHKFTISKKNKRGTLTAIARFYTKNFMIEIFGQNLPVEQQMAYRHMIVEAKILEAKGDKFRQEIIRLKKNGMKTEPAFAHLLNLKGDPYQALLHYEI